MRMFGWTARQLHVPRRAGVFALAAMAVLATAGGALAWNGFFSASQVSAEFFANTVSNSHSQTCTAANNDSIQVTDATFAGTASSSDSNLNGPITIEARSVYDATTNAGTVWGRVSINSGGAGFQGRLIAVNVNGQLQGFVVGRENGGGTLAGNVSSTFSTAGGFASSTSHATIGGNGAAADSAVLATSSCSPSGNHDGHGDDNVPGLGKAPGLGNFTGPGKSASIGKFLGVGHQNRHGNSNSQD